MAVQEQTPYIEHIANGVTTSFALEFVCDSADKLVVTINDLPTNVGDWSFGDGCVVFQYPPLSDSTIKIWRNSPLARSTTFKTYDNSLNPNSLNLDLDKIWLVMQELNVKNFISDNKLQELLDKLVDGDINGLPAEVLARIAGDESIKSLVNLEAIRAYQAESNLSVRIDNESLLANQNILAEKQRAEAAEQGLQIQVNSVGVGNKAYLTYALMDADKANIPAKSKVTVTNDATTSNNGDWQWDGAVFTKSAYDPLAQAKKYTDNVDEKNNELRQSVVRYKSDHAYTLMDDFGNIVAYIDGVGHLHLTELTDTVQNMLTQLKNSTVATNELIHTSTSDSNGFHITDYLGNYVLSIMSNGELYIPTIDKPVQTVISSMQGVIDFESYFPNIAFQFALSETEKKTDINIVQRFNNIKNRAKASDFILKKSASSLYGENNTTIQRIPALLKLSSTKVLMLFNQGIIGYGGDGDGAKMYQKTITIGANNSIQISETKLFHQVNDIYHAGIVKHAQLCRLQDGRVCCVFEVNLQGVLKYKQYVRYSSDDGQTWTEPTLVTFSNASEIDSITWSTDSKTLVLQSGRLVQAVYLRNEYKVASAYSDDNGLTWTLSPYVASPTGTWHTESTFVRLSDGTIKFWFRDESNPGVKRIYTSTDNGETLQYVGSGNFSCPPCQASSLTLSDGTVVISTPTAINGRTKFKLLFSLDNGQTFDLMTLPFAKTKFMAYSSIIALSDDLLMCAVEGNWGSGAVNTNTFEDIGIFLINTSGALKYGFNS